MTERKAVSNFIQKIVKRNPGLYIFTDRDHPGRVHRSGWDFLISTEMSCLHIEAKLSNNRKKFIEDPVTLLRDSQVSERKKILDSNGCYAILIFYPEMKTAEIQIEIGHVYKSFVRGLSEIEAAIIKILQGA